LIEQGRSSTYNALEKHYPLPSSYWVLHNALNVVPSPCVNWEVGPPPCF